MNHSIDKGMQLFETNHIILENKRQSLKEILMWCYRNNIEYQYNFHYDTNREALSFWFGREEDATIFALRWIE